jgi:FMN phosphatase YigB (HAD superfamily)
MKHPIKNIIFDLGGVLFDINYHLTAEAFEKIGVKDFKNIFAKKGQADVIDRLEEGKIGIDELTKELSVLCGINLSKQQVIEAWNVMLFNIPTPRFELLKELRKKYRVFLYSNINEIHEIGVHQRLQEKYGIANLENHFEKVYYSHLIGIRKPNKEGFLYIIDDQQINANETLFIDDSPQHVEGALKAGLQAVWLDLEKQDIHELVEELGL